MILLPVLGRTRSSLVTGIFAASGAWVGSSTVSMIGRYDTFENWEVIMYLQKTFAKRGPMCALEAREAAPAFREFVRRVVPADRVVCLKFVWYYHNLFRAAFPESDFYFVSRKRFRVRADRMRKKQGMFAHYKREMRSGTWIESEKLVAKPPDFSEIKAIIDQYSALQWNQQGVDALYASNGDVKFKELAKVNR